MKLRSKWKDTQTEHNFAATVPALVSPQVYPLSSKSIHQDDHYFKWQLRIITTYQPVYRIMYSYIGTYKGKHTWRQTMADDDTHFKHTCTLWRSRTHIFWKCFALWHFVARNISDQPVMPFSILGVLAAGSIRIWQCKPHNIMLKLNCVQLPSVLQVTFLGHARP